MLVIPKWIHYTVTKFKNLISIIWYAEIRVEISVDQHPGFYRLLEDQIDHIRAIVRKNMNSSLISSQSY